MCSMPSYMLVHRDCYDRSSEYSVTMHRQSYVDECVLFQNLLRERNGDTSSMPIARARWTQMQEKISYGSEVFAGL